MRDVSKSGAIPDGTRAALVTIFVALLYAGLANAVVNPQSEKDNSPVAVVCQVLSVATQDQEERTKVRARCRVVEVIRSANLLRDGQTITIRYTVSNDKKVAEIPKTPGPAPATEPPILREGQTVTAYLKPAESADGNIHFVPNIGFFSFENASSQAGDEPSRPTPTSCEPPPRRPDSINVSTPPWPKA